MFEEQDTGATRSTGVVVESAPNCAIVCPQVNDSVAPTFSPNGTSPANANVKCTVIYNGGAMFQVNGVADNAGNWRVQFNNLPLTGSDQGHTTTMIGAAFLDGTGTLLCTVGPFSITVAQSGKSCS